MSNDSNISKMYQETLDAIKICLDSLKDIAEASPTNGIVRGRALDTINLVKDMLNLKEE